MALAGAAYMHRLCSRILFQLVGGACSLPAGDKEGCMGGSLPEDAGSYKMSPWVGGQGAGKTSEPW